MKNLFFSFLFLLPLISFSQSNHAISLKGDSYLDLGQTAGNGVRTIEMWFNPEKTIGPNLTDYQTLIGREVNPQNEDEFVLVFWPSNAPMPGHLIFRISDDVNNQYRVISDTNTWEAGVWHHVAIVIDSMRGTEMYIDGRLQRDSNTHNRPSATANTITTVGCYGNNFYRYFKGKVDDVRISAAAEYASNFTPPCPSLKSSPQTLGMWSLDEGLGNTAIDSSGSGNHASIINAAYVKACICNQGNSLFFDGQNASVDLGDQVGSGVRTVEMWFKPAREITPNMTDYQTLITREVNAINEDEFVLLFWPSFASSPGHLMFRYSEDVNNQYRIISDTNFWQKDVWHHVAVVIDSVLGMRMFIDGQLQQSTHAFSQATSQVVAPTMVGAFGVAGYRPFYGQIEDIHLASEALYEQNFTPPCPDRSPETSTLGLWHFNEGNGATVLDASNQGNDGDILGAVYACDSICSMTIGIEEELAAVDLKIFPNPVNGKLFIQKNGTQPNESARLRVISLKGETILLVDRVWNNNEIQVDIPSGIASGIYVLQVLSPDGGVAYCKISVE